MLPTVFGENLFDDFFDDSFGTVSYTHLDVYKRQNQFIVRVGIENPVFQH